MMGAEVNSQKVGIPEASSKGRDGSRQDPSGRRGQPWPSDSPHPPGPSAGTGLCHDQGSHRPFQPPQGRARSQGPLWGHVFFDPEPDAVLPSGLEPGWMSGGED